MSDHGHGADASGHGDTKKSGAGMGWLALIPVVLVAIVIFKFLFFQGGSSESQNDAKQDGTEESHSKSPAYSNIITVSYGPEYGKTYHVPAGCKGFFAEATTAYCCINADGTEGCGDEGEDILFKKLKDTNSNTSLRFKSKNGGTGSLKIVITSK